MNEMNVNLKALLDKEDWLITSLSNASALLNEYLDNINWVGFYLMQNGELVLGPFQGKTACVRIKVGRGVCGTAVSEDKTQLVPDVHQFPGHIACDSASNSEIVVPIHHNGEVVAVLDIDSPLFNRFSEEDKVNLEESAKIIEEIWK
jgi:GAF domain-containing protein